jgi:hypothetical protein
VREEGEWKGKEEKGKKGGKGEKLKANQKK